VSDAGTPLISDPGYKLTRACIEAGIAVHAVPGASAALAALVVSGLPSDRFLFAGFAPPRSSARRRFFAELAAIRASLIVYESPRRLAESLADAALVLGPRPAVMARELTKLHEEVRRGTLAELAAHYAQAEPPKGEVVLVIGPPGADEGAVSADDLDRRLTEALKTASLRDAVAAVAAATGLPRKQVYERALALGRQ
jgi:16S rRNA (cytidine1402-2'-O)-methyltransferase